MNKKVLAALAISALTATSAFAALSAPGTGVLGSVHDMNVVGNNITPDAQGRVCAFCHTPHHAIEATVANKADYLPLWSHNLTTQNFLQYNSDTFDAGKIADIDPLVGPSRLCMSCHDGAIAPDQHYGNSGGTLFTNNEFYGDTPVPGTLSIGIGASGKLNRTHPIGFVFKDAVDADQSATGSNPNGGFQAGVATGDAAYLGNPLGKKIKSQLWNGYMTCATCHDVHNKDNAPNDGTAAAADGLHPDSVKANYLVFSPQSGSQLCLSCHAK